MTTSFVEPSVKLEGKELYVGDKIEGTVIIKITGRQSVHIRGADIKYRVSEWNTFSHDPEVDRIGDYSFRIRSMNNRKRDGFDKNHDLIFYECDYWLFGMKDTAGSRGRHPDEVLPGTYSYPFVIPIPADCPPTAHFGTHAGPQLRGILDNGPQVIVDHRLCVEVYIADSANKISGITVPVKNGIPQSVFDGAQRQPRQYYVTWPSNNHMDCHISVKNDGIIALDAHYAAGDTTVPIVLNFDGPVGAGRVALVRRVVYTQKHYYRVVNSGLKPEGKLFHGRPPRNYSTEEHLVGEKVTNGSTDPGHHQLTIHVPILNIEDTASLVTRELDVSYFVTFVNAPFEQRPIVPIMFVHRVDSGNPQPDHRRTSATTTGPRLPPPPATTTQSAHNDAGSSSVGASADDVPVKVAASYDAGEHNDDDNSSSSSSSSSSSESGSGTASGLAFGGGGSYTEPQQLLMPRAPTLPYGSDSSSHNDNGDEASAEATTPTSKNY